MLLFIRFSSVFRSNHSPSRLPTSEVLFFLRWGISSARNIFFRARFNKNLEVVNKEIEISSKLIGARHSFEGSDRTNRWNALFNVWQFRFVTEPPLLRSDHPEEQLLMSWGNSFSRLSLTLIKFDFRRWFFSSFRVHQPDASKVCSLRKNRNWPRHDTRRVENSIFPPANFLQWN